MRWLYTLLLFLAANQGSGSGVLHGRIVEWTTGLPIVDATVTVYRERATAMVRRSGNDGLVTFENLPPGQYSIRVVANGYSLKDGKQSVDGSDYQIVDVGPGTSLELRIDLVPSGTIGGTVRDANDNPLGGMRVVPLRRQYNLFGDLVLARANTGVRTNDRGEYVVSGLPPGEYFIKVESQPPVYYPGSSDPRNVAPVVVSPTLTSVSGIHIQVRGDPPSRISGRVVNFDRSMGEVAVDTLYLVPLGFDDGVADVRTFNNQSVARDGSFLINDVAPGPYEIVATLSSNGRRYFGRARIDVNSRELNDVEVMLSPAVDLAGSVSVRAGLDLPDVSRLTIGLVPTLHRVQGLGSGPGRTDRDGNLRVSSVFPDEYRINVINVPNGYYVDSILLDNLEVLERSAVVYPSTSTLQVTLNRPALNLTGKVVTERGAPPVEPLLVLLAPIETGGDPVQSIKQTVSVRKTGDFSFPNVPPGRYRLFAFQNVPRGFPFYDPKFLDPYMSRGTLMTVEGPNAVVPNIIAITVRP